MYPIYVVFHCSTKTNTQAIFTSRVSSAKQVNQAQSTWTATSYPQFEGLSIEELLSMTGGRISKDSGYRVNYMAGSVVWQNVSSNKSFIIILVHMMYN